MSATLVARPDIRPAVRGSAEQERARNRHFLRPTPALFLLASIVLTLLASSSAPTPLYATYQSEWHFSPITTTVVFGIYAIAVLAALLVAGKLSDHVGRKPVLLTALLVQIATMVVFSTAGGVGQLVVARVIQGLATGSAVGAIGAGMLDVDRARGTTLNAVAPISGTALGALLSGLLVQYVGAPTHVVYYVLLGLFVLQAAAVLLLRETVSRAPGALRSLKPEIALPARLRGPVLTAMPVLLAVWALAGFYGSLSPALLRTLVGHSSPTLGGLALFVVAGAGAVSMFLTISWAPHRLMYAGAAALVVGIGVVELAVRSGSVVGFFIGTAITGVGFGGGFQGGIRNVMPLTEAHERAGVLSLLYVVSYFGMGVPAVAAGWLVVHGGGLVTTTYEYGLAVAVLAVLAALSLVRQRRLAVVAA